MDVSGRKSQKVYTLSVVVTPPQWSKEPETASGNYSIHLFTKQEQLLAILLEKMNRNNKTENCDQQTKEQLCSKTSLESIKERTHTQQRGNTKCKNRMIRSKSFHVSSRGQNDDEKELPPNGRSRQSRPNRRSTPILNSSEKSKENETPKRRISFEDIWNTESRGKQIEKELQKHSLSEEEMNLLIIDLVQPLDLVGMILKRN